MALAAQAVDAWVAEAYAAIHYLASLRIDFTSEDVVAMVGLPRIDTGKDRNNAVGAVMSGAARRGVIVRTGQMRRAHRSTSHAALLTVWQGAGR